MSIEFQVRRIEEVVNVIENLPLKIRETVDERLGRSAEAIAEKAREIVPVETGFLRNTISTSRTSQFNWKVQATAPYAKFVKYGSSRNPPHPFLLPALILMKLRVIELVKEGIREAVEET